MQASSPRRWRRVEKTRANANGHHWGPIAATFSSRGARPGAKPAEEPVPCFPLGHCRTGLASQRARPRAPEQQAGPALGRAARSATLSPGGTGPQGTQAAPSGKLAPHRFCPGPPLAGPPFRGLSDGLDRSTSPFVSAEPFPRYFFFFSGTQKDGAGGAGAGSRPRPVRTLASRPCRRLIISGTLERLSGRPKPPLHEWVN